MTCDQPSTQLYAFLDNELTPPERARVQTHLQTCANCRVELAQLSSLQKRVQSTLHHQVAAVQPSDNAWHNLAPRLQSVSPLPQSTHGGIFVKRTLFVGATVAVLVFALLAVWMTQNANPVSAQEILDRSAQIQQTAQTQGGIQHLQSKIYFNPEAAPSVEQTPGEARTTLWESYHDFANNKARTVIRDSNTNQITEIVGTDGSNLYSTKSEQGEGAVSVVYRTPQATDVALPFPVKRIDGQDAFEQMRQDAQNARVTQEQWEDGRAIYVLRTEDANNNIAMQNGVSTSSAIYFDANTYQVLGQDSYATRNGQTTLYYSNRILLDETLPADAAIAWDLTDIGGIRIVDESNNNK